MWWLILVVGALAVSLKIYERRASKRVVTANGTPIQYAPISQCIQQLAGPKRVHQCEFHLNLSRMHNSNPFMYFLAHIPVVVFSHPDHVRAVNLQWKSFEKTTQFLGPHARKMLGENVVFANGEQWAAMRSIMDPAFYNVERFIPLMDRKSTKCLEIASRLPQPVNVPELMTALTLDVLGEAVLGYDFCCLDSLEESNNISRRNKTLIAHYHYMMKEAASIMRIVGGDFVAGLPISSNYKLQEAMTSIDDLIQQIIDKCRKKSSQREAMSLLEMMIAKSDSQEGNEFTDEHIRSNVIVFLVAGHDTTQTSLSFITYALAKMPEIQKKLREKLETESWQDSTYLDALIKENLRLFPPGPTSISRKSTKDQVIGGYRIKAGQHVECSYYAMQRDPTIWGCDADQFRPERFEADIKQKHAFAPFGGGSRTCIGKSFSITEQKIFLKNLVSRFNITLPDETYEIKYMDQGPLLAVDRNFVVNFYNVH